MNSMIAYCGLDCQTCPIHLATLERDDAKRQAMRVSIARICSGQYGMNVLPQDVTDCDGCRGETGRLFSGCVRCEIRPCAIAHKLESCAFCNEYGCDKLVQHFRSDPTAEKRLHAIRSQR